jgi:hypothetical protein
MKFVLAILITTTAFAQELLPTYSCYGSLRAELYQENKKGKIKRTLKLKKRTHYFIDYHEETGTCQFTFEGKWGSSNYSQYPCDISINKRGKAEVKLNSETLKELLAKINRKDKKSEVYNQLIDEIANSRNFELYDLSISKTKWSKNIDGKKNVLLLDLNVQQCLK